MSYKIIYRKYIKVIKIFSISTYAEALSKGRFSKMGIRNGMGGIVFLISSCIWCFFLLEHISGGGEVSGGGTHYM
jgi:hypothetical protein